MVIVPLVKLLLIVFISERAVTIFNLDPDDTYIVNMDDFQFTFTMEFEVIVTRSGFHKRTISVDNGRPVVVWDVGDKDPKICKICPAVNSINTEYIFLGIQKMRLNNLLAQGLWDIQRICVRYVCLFLGFDVLCDVYHTTDTVRAAYTRQTGKIDIQGSGTFSTSDAKGIGTYMIESNVQEIKNKWRPTVQKLKQLAYMNVTEVEFWYNTTGLTTCVVTSRSNVPFTVELSLNNNSSAIVTDESTVDCQILTVKAPGSHAQRCYVTSSLGWKGVVTPPSQYRTKRVPVNISSSKWTGIVNWKGNVNRSTASHLPNLPILILCVVFMRLVV
ncbi:m157 protein [Murid betaherpesvirus 1]|uniref:M157 n=1 Tax=Murid herpesvirus 1 TaxID=10366 RepID=A0A0M4L8R0_MUHV1|nr:m157 [Murid betaherpesvirus 1]UNW45383.1 m157 protein [Murid betaherpesvirus 1]